MTSRIKLREEDVQGLSWEVMEVTPDYRRSRAQWGKYPSGNPVYVWRTEYLAADELLEANQAQRNDTDGTRWSSGMGSDKGGNVPLVKVASIPLNVFYDQIAPHIRDKDHIDWWLKRDENQPFRTRRGNL